MKFEIGKVYKCMTKREEEIIKIESIDYDSDKIYYEILEDPYDVLGDIRRGLSNALRDNYVELPAYNTPLWKVLNG